MLNLLLAYTRHYWVFDYWFLVVFGFCV